MMVIVLQAGELSHLEKEMSRELKRLPAGNMMLLKGRLQEEMGEIAKNDRDNLDPHDKWYK